MGAQPKRDSRCCYICKDKLSRAKGEISKVFLRAPNRPFSIPRNVWVCEECKRLNPEWIVTWGVVE